MKKNKTKLAATIAAAMLTLGLTFASSGPAFATGGAPTMQTNSGPSGTFQLPVNSKCYYDRFQHGETKNGYTYFYTWTGQKSLVTIPGTKTPASKYIYNVESVTYLGGPLFYRGTVFQYC